MIADSVPIAAHQRVPYIAQPNHCLVCSLELPAGYGRHPTCDPRWLRSPEQVENELRTLERDGR